MHAAGAVHMTEEVIRNVSDNQERDNVDEVDKFLTDTVLVGNVMQHSKPDAHEFKTFQT